MIQRLISANNEQESFIINKDEAVLILENDQQKREFLLIKKLDTLSIEKLSAFKDFTKFRYFGPIEIFDKLYAEKFHWIKICDNKIINDTQTQIWYFPKTGKIRIPADKIKSTIKRKVLIIDDSKVIQKLLTNIINKSSKLEVMACANCPSMATKIIEENRPDIITLDIHMPEQNGVEYLKSHLKYLNIPVIMISSVSINESEMVMEALGNGALTYIQKPSMDELKDQEKDIIEKLENIQPTQIISPLSKNSIIDPTLHFNDTLGLIAIGSSTGGTQALEVILSSLPKKIPPIVIVQHIPSVFSTALAKRLDAVCSFNVKEAVNGEVLVENCVYLAPGDKQFKLTKKMNDIIAIVNNDPPLNHFRPSVDYLFDSIPNLKINKVVGVILTGMGKDGALGLLKLKESKAFTIAQDKDSCVVFGMPKEAIAINAVLKVLPLDKIGNGIVSEYNRLISTK